MRISGSILAVSDNHMGYAKMLKYAHVDYLHVDIFKNKGYQIEELLKFNDSDLPRDVHLIFETIEQEEIDILNKAKIAYVNIQYENLLEKDALVDLSTKLDASFGIAFTSDTSLEVIEKYIPFCSQIMFMCSEPGVSGAQFDESNYERVLEMHDKHPKLPIFVDGGINDIRAEQFEKMGAAVIVSGSYLCKNFSNIGEVAYNLKYINCADVVARDILIPKSMLPIVEKDSNFLEILEAMNRYRFGMVFVVEKDCLTGIVAYGDIRRGIVKYDRNVFDCKAKDLMNNKPYFIGVDISLQRVYGEISKMHKGIDVIPVLDKGTLVGAVDLRTGI